MQQTSVLYKTLVVGVIVLFIGMSVVSSTGNTVDNIPLYTQILDVVDNSQELLSREKIAYGYIVQNGSGRYPEGPWYFPLFDTSNMTSLGSTQSDNYLIGGTWACDDRWFGIEYMTGIIWEIDPDTGDMWSIGGGGSNCFDLSYNPVTKKLYSVCSSAIYEINITTGEQYLICDLSGELNHLFHIAFDKNGILYGWENSGLWIIDIETCEVTPVWGFRTLDICSSHFDWYTNKLYVTACVSGCALYEVDMETGTAEFKGSIAGGELRALAISFDCLNQPPEAPVIDGPHRWPAGKELCLTFHSTDPDGGDIKYIIDWGDNTTNETEFNPACLPVEVCHTWDEMGTYIIKAKAVDIWGVESDWSEPFSIEIPRTRTSSYLWYEWFLERFPLLHRLLSFLLL